MTISDLQDDIKAAVAVLKVIESVFPSKIEEAIIAFLTNLPGNTQLMERLHDKVIDDILSKK